MSMMRVGQGARTIVALVELGVQMMRLKGDEGAEGAGDGGEAPIARVAIELAEP
jgi:hypothetical protein